MFAPEPLDAQHRIDDFDCGSQSLNDWLRKHALRNQSSGASRTFVVRDGERVIAYYALASSAVALDTATGRLRRNMPDPVPVVVLGRLAVDVAYQGHGLGRALLQDAGRRVLNGRRRRFLELLLGLLYKCGRFLFGLGRRRGSSPGRNPRCPPTVR